MTFLPRSLLGCRRILSNDTGAMLPIMAAAVLVLCATAALAIDYGQIALERNRLQIAAEASALAAAKSLTNPGAAQKRAIALAGINMPVDGHGNVLKAGDVQVGTWDPATRSFSPGGNTAVKIVTRRAATNKNPLSLTFAKVIGIDSIDLEAEAIAVSESAICFDAETVTVVGSFMIDDYGCEHYVNSPSASALSMTGSFLNLSDDVHIVGGYSGTPSAGKPLHTGSDEKRISDPISSALSLPGACLDTGSPITVNGGTVTISPGQYCEPITIAEGTLKLDPGIYALNEPIFAHKSGLGVSPRLEGTGVTLVFTNNARLDVDTSDVVGHSDALIMQLTPPTSGPTAGVVIYQSASAAGNQNIVKGALNLAQGDLMSGLIYIPDQNLNVTGSLHIDGGVSLALAVKVFQVTGSVRFGFKAPSVQGAARLVAFGG